MKKTKKQLKKLWLKRKAYHEAGHAVMAYMVNFSPYHVTIRRRGEDAGHCRYHPPRLCRGKDYLLTKLAGFVAEWLCPELTFEEDEWKGSIGDIEAINKILENYTLEKRAEILQKVGKECAEYFYVHYPAIVHALARVLLEKRTIHGVEEIAKIIEDADMG